MSEDTKSKSWKFPTTYAILFAMLVLVAGLTYVMPAGFYNYRDAQGNVILAHEYQQLEAGERRGLEPIAGTFTRVENKGQLMSIILAPVRGLYDSVEIVAFVLFIGGFLGVVTRTRAIDVGIARLMENMKDRIYLLMAVLMFIFSTGGFSYGMGEETIAFYPILLPIMIMAGFDVMAAAAVILLGAGIGVLTSIVNPFATGIASGLAGVSITDGMGLRIVQWMLFVSFTIFYVLRYAIKTHKNPELSVTRDLNESINKEILANSSQGNVEKLTGRQKLVLVLFIATFMLMIFSLIPFSDWSVALEPITMGWYFAEIAALFLGAAILIGVVGGLSEEEIGQGFVAGARDVLGVVFVLVLSRGIKILMDDGMIIDSILAYSEGLTAGLPKVLYINVVYLVHVVLSIFIPSTSGLAGLSMPIMAPLADMAGVSKSLVITAYQSASGLVNMVTPTGGILMGALMLARIPYDRYIKFAFKYLITIFLGTMALLTFGVLFGIG
jgi:uncharacterized ion transporter superfamily protein YfcC